MFSFRETTPLRKLLTLHALTGSESLVEETATPGNPCTFETDVRKNLTQCKVLFTPVQESGTPSPESPLPITGLTGIHVYHSGEDETDYDTYAVSWAESGTMYGGYINLTTGELVKTYEIKTLNGSESWSENAKTSTLIMLTAKITDSVIVANSDTTIRCVCDKMKGVAASVATTGARAEYNIAIISSNRVYVVMPLADIPTVPDFEQWLSDNNITVAYQLETPVTVATLTATEIKTLIGENNLWSDANGNLEVKYMKKG